MNLSECVWVSGYNVKQLREKKIMSSVKPQEQSSLDQTTQQNESETPPVKPSTTDRVVDSKYFDPSEHQSIICSTDKLFVEVKFW